MSYAVVCSLPHANDHSTLGAQALNTGLNDAMTPGWKPAATIKGSAPDGLLDSYMTERHPADVIRDLIDTPRRHHLLRRQDERFLASLRFARYPPAHRPFFAGIRRSRANLAG
jgi:2-polyprenyl-6-methoxyphenol hydroxylase-like FAD-dependent oxidoreductase